LVIIDKLAKYIKISPYYEQWNAFKNAHKADKELDNQIKEALLAKLNTDVSLTLTIRKEAPTLMPAAPVKKITPVIGLKTAKTLEEQKSLVHVRKSVVIKKKSP
jgi:hypothetical protein